MFAGIEKQKYKKNRIIKRANLIGQTVFNASDASKKDVFTPAVLRVGGAHLHCNNDKITNKTYKYSNNKKYQDFFTNQLLIINN